MNSIIGFKTDFEIQKYSETIPDGIPPREDAPELSSVKWKELIGKIKDHSAQVGVVGLGYVGLPLAVEKAKAGYSVVGIDLNQLRVNQINRGENFIADVNDDELRELVEKGLLKATADFVCTADLDVIVIAVPTPLTKNLTPDLSYVEKATNEIARYLRPGQLVCLESTTYPGTSEDVILPILRRSGLKLEEDFFIAHSPERVDPGNQRFSTKNTSKVVGGIGPRSHEVALAFYSATIDNVISVSNAKTAELVKLFENTFRAVNIALVNELAILCARMELNVWEVLEAAHTKPFGIMPFFPGPGVGGHCIPLDPHYLEWKARELNFSTRFITLAGEINRSMPSYVVDRLVHQLERGRKSLSGARISVLGVSYKRDIGDYRESPAIEVIQLLRRRGATVVFHDPFVPAIEGHGLQMEGQELTAEFLGLADITVVLTDHTQIDYDWVVAHSRAVFDTRNCTRKVKQNRERIELL